MKTPQFALWRLLLAIACFGGACGIVSFIWTNNPPSDGKGPDLRAVYLVLFAPLWCGFVGLGIGTLLGRPVAGFVGCAIAALLLVIGLVVLTFVQG